MAISVIAGLGIAVAAAGTGYQIESSIEAGEDADYQNMKAEEAQKKLLQDQKDAEAKSDAATADAEAKAQGVLDRNSARARLKALNAGRYGRSDTILTSPLGVLGQQLGGNKTLLGL